jgi:Flp pilus assembly protein TadG
MMTSVITFRRTRLFSIVHASLAARTVTDVRAPIQGHLKGARAIRKKEAGQAIIEFALSFTLFLTLLLGGLDLGWAEICKQNLDYTVQTTATCLAQTPANCSSDPQAYAISLANGLGLHGSILVTPPTYGPGSVTITATYTASLTGFLGNVPLSATATAVVP